MLKKTLIRKHFVELIKTNLLLADGRVFGGRIAPYEKDNLYPAVSIYNRNDSVEEYYTDHTLRNMDMEMVLAVKQNSTIALDNYDFDEVVENIQVEIEKLISRIISVGNVPDDPFKLVEEIVYVSSTTSFNSDSGDNIGYSNIVYNIKYRIQNPIENHDLVDFDEIASYQNIDIINLRPLQGFE